MYYADGSTFVRALVCGGMGSIKALLVVCGMLRECNGMVELGKVAC